MIVTGGIVWLSASVEAAPRSSASSLRYCLLDDTCKVFQKECRLLQKNILEQAKAQEQQQASEQSNVANADAENEAVTMNATSVEPEVAETVPAACPQPQDGTGYHHGYNQQGTGWREDHGNGQVRGHGLQDGSGAGGQRGHNGGNCLR